MGGTRTAVHGHFQGMEEARLPGSDKHRLGRQRHQGDRLLADLVEDGLLAGQHGAAHGVDDVVVALGIDDAAVAQRVGVGGELIFDLQVLDRETMS